MLTIGADGFVGLPIGDFAEGVDLGIGALLSLSYNLNPQLDLTGRAGLIYFLLENGDGVTLYDIPIWFGGRYKLSPGDQGPYLHGEFGFNHYRISFDNSFGGSGSDSETEIGVNLLGGIKMGNLTLEGGLYIGSIDEDSSMLGGTVGTTF